MVNPTPNLLLGAGTAGNLTTDAHLAAIAIEHGATLASFERDFWRFAGLVERTEEGSVSVPYEAVEILVPLAQVA